MAYVSRQRLRITRLAHKVIPRRCGRRAGSSRPCCCPAVFLCEDGGGSVFASGSWMATSKEFLLPDSTVTYRGVLVGCAQKKAYQRPMNPTEFVKGWKTIRSLQRRPLPVADARRLLLQLAIHARQTRSNCYGMTRCRSFRGRSH